MKLAASEAAPKIDWAAVDAAAQADAPDEDSPELSAADVAELRPMGQVLPGVSVGKTRITIHIDDAVLQAYKARAGGRGYQTLINEALRRGLQADAVKEALREVLREERHTGG
ncbi:BrnA antitoxin family protein [Leptothrix discophora]|uniref:BrnA antitoxin family protein n=1 Tax=Leptothrix discophora TaxID=89 RepID=A0ABT9G1M7_LEPDI|nr:BrnA antitoxin family protein [Leptothrix discophora]MDP4300353.1 BrnA antitoxin family protein [Leptothrix discophora]